MPVYLKRSHSFTPPSIDDVPSEDEDDFIQDPDQLKDRLPQPFRMIDRTISDLVDEVWDIVYNREHARITEAARVKPPQYECAVQMMEHGKASAIASSPDGKYMFVGLPNGIAVFDALSRHTVDFWEQNGMDIVHLQVAALTDDLYAVTTIDVMGLAQVFAFAGELYLLHTINDQNPEAKVIASKVDLSSHGDYFGVFLENPSEKEGWLDVYRCPKESWLKELESLVAKATEKKQTLTPVHSPVPTEIGEAQSSADLKHPQDGAVVEGGGVEEGDTKSVEDRSQSPSTSFPADRSQHKFSPPTLVLKVRPPQAIQGVTYSSAQQLSKTVDQGEVIGSGVNHLVSVSHLQQRGGVFDQLHEQYMRYLPDTPTPPLQQPSFHFLTPGRMLPQGLELNTPDVPTTVAVWWSGGTQLMHYSLLKQAKDVEHKAELVWPFSSPVVAVTASPCTSLLAVALHNGNVVVWDKHIGLQRRIVRVSEVGQLDTITFLDPSVCPQERDETVPYQTRNAIYLLVACKDGQLCLVSCGLGSEDPIQEAFGKAETDSDLFTSVRPIAGIPELVVTCNKTGRVFIQDLLAGRVLCEVTMPAQFEILQPWEPIISSGGQGQMLYLRATLKHKREEETSDPADISADTTDPIERPEEATDALFVFQLRSFPALDLYRSKERAKESSKERAQKSGKERSQVPYVIHNTIEKRAEALLAERITQQALRKDRMQKRWHHLKQELELIKQMKQNKGQQLKTVAPAH